MDTYKSGSTVRYLFQFDDAKWSALFPFESIRAEAKPSKPAAGSPTEYEMEIDINEQTKSIMASAITRGWPKGSYSFDIRFEKNGEYFYVPPTGNITFQLSNPVTDGE